MRKDKSKMVADASSSEGSGRGALAFLKGSLFGTRKGSALERPLAVGLVEGAYVMLLGFLFMRLLYTLVTPLNIPSNVPDTRAGDTATDVGIFEQYDPFGTTEESTPAAQFAQVEETRLDLKLVGTFVTGDLPSATIQTDAGNQRLFFVDDEVISGVTILDVLPDQVILSRRGVRETLSLEGRVDISRATPAQQPKARSASNAFVMMTSAPSGTGYILAPGRNARVFNAAGLLSGDQLIAINGRAVPKNIPQTSGTLMRQLSRGPVTLTILRTGVTLDIILDPTGSTP